MDAQEVLKQNGLSTTESRKAIMQLFLESKGALEHSVIEKKTKDQFDRVTIYRTLQTFQKNGLIHTVPSSDSVVKYALCKHDCGEGHHHDDHVHFICDTCGITYCLESITVPEVKLPKGFSMSDINVLVNGVCKSCS